MGDNRADSADSRDHPDDPGEGTIPESAVVGRAVAAIWPPSQVRSLPIPGTFAQSGLARQAGAATQAGTVGQAGRARRATGLGRVGVAAPGPRR
jgi:signal peptidase I